VTYPALATDDAGRALHEQDGFQSDGRDYSDYSNYYFDRLG
jgi:hypothetical protein